MADKMSKSDAGKLGGEASRATLRAAKEKREDKYNTSPSICKFCDCKLPYEKRHLKFCDHSCAASRTNQSTSRNLKHGDFVEKPCLECGKITINLKFCSRDCIHRYNWKETVKEIEEAGTLLEAKGIYNYNPIVAKRYLAENRGRKCSICGGEKWMGEPIPLVLDHINGDPTNHKLDNVRLVCGNCNMMLPTFSGRNRGKGRSWRYQKDGTKDLDEILRGLGDEEDQM